MAEMPLRKFLKRGTPQMKTITLSNIQGIQAWSGAFGETADDSSGLSRDTLAGVPAFRLTSRGCQKRSSVTSPAIEVSEETMSTSHGPWKFDTRNCGMAKQSPAVSAAGQTPSMPRKPDIATTTQKGTINEKSGNWRPTIFERVTSSIPVTPLRAMIGVPSAPNATGAVLAMSESPEAASGLKP